MAIYDPFGILTQPGQTNPNFLNQGAQQPQTPQPTMPQAAPQQQPGQGTNPLSRLQRIMSGPNNPLARILGPILQRVGARGFMPPTTQQFPLGGMSGPPQANAIRSSMPQNPFQKLMGLFG